MNWRIEKKLSVTAVFIAATFYMVFGSTGANNFFPLLSHQEALAQQQAQEQPAATVEIPLSKGYIDGKIAYFIATDASTEQAVQSITNNTGFPVNHAPILAMTPESERGQGYLFLNGAKGQLPVANAVP